MNLAIFSDIHFGDNKDSKAKLSTSVQYIKNFIEICKTNNVEKVLFLGDWYDNRKTLNTTTIRIADQCINQIAKYFPIYLIVGNHDIPSIDNDSTINNITYYKNINNVTVIDNPYVEIIDNKKLLFVPFGYNNFDVTEKYDYMFGHFEFNGAIVTSGKLDDRCKINISDIVRLSPLTFTGHYHINKEYISNNGKLISVGSPFEMDWGDYNNQKGIYILNTTNGLYNFIPNKFSPKHIKFYWSKKDSIDKNIIPYNYIKLIIDDVYEYDKVLDLLKFINMQNPLENCIPEFTYSLNNHLENTTTNIEIVESIKDNNMDIISYVDKYIDKMDDKIFDNINKSTLKLMFNKFYQME